MRYKEMEDMSTVVGQWMIWMVMDGYTARDTWMGQKRRVYHD